MKKLSILLLILIASCVIAEGKADGRTYKVKCLKNISYLTQPTTDAYRQKMSQLDLYIPEGAKNFPTLVYFHGGGMTGGRREGPVRLSKLGVAVAAVEYRLYPKCKHPEYIEDCAAATAWVFKNIKKYGGNPDKIFIGGYSAGSYLAAMLAMDKDYLAAVGVNADKLAGALLQSGHTITHFTVRKQLGYKVQQGICDKNSPMYHIRKTPFPILLQCGNNDYPSRQEENRLFESMMRKYANQPASRIEYREYEGTHGTLPSNKNFRKDTEIFVLKNSSLPYSPRNLNEKKVKVYTRSCMGKNVLDLSELQGNADSLKVVLDSKPAAVPQSGVVSIKQAAPSEVSVIENFKVKAIPASKEFNLKDGKDNAMAAPGGVKFWTADGKIFFELKANGKSKVPENGKYYTADGIEIFFDRTPLRKLASNSTNTKGLNTKQYLFSAQPDSKGNSFAVKNMSAGSTDITKQSKAELNSTINDTGYTMLVSIPLTEITALNDGNVIGLNILVNNYSSGKNQTVNLSGKDEPSYLKRFHYPIFSIDACKNIKK